MKTISIIFLSVIFCVSCKHKTEDPTPLTRFANVVILGNSITFNAPDGLLGWTGSWGMAASSAGQDYVHLLTAKLRSYNDTCKVSAVNIASFETQYANFNIDSALRKYRDVKPDLLILRIGENVPNGFDRTLFPQKYQALISYMKANNPNLKILAVGSFFTGKDIVDGVMTLYSPFISLSKLGGNYKNLAIDLTGVSDGVKQHPNDRGMQAISDAIWEQVRVM